ncbi:hypothetical protein EVAR_28111_1 [Eumeta japonica]|uniref:Uncharacterized protein n=1 Tax=Eumeta variegata TaxID=151549 RepID=A0A4C1VE04_EUMVA|nr:hypothetical protein EVAR_28111_1 [Eumeta japonica]
MAYKGVESHSELIDVTTDPREMAPLRDGSLTAPAAGRRIALGTGTARGRGRDVPVAYGTKKGVVSPGTLIKGERNLSGRFITGAVDAVIDLNPIKSCTAARARTPPSLI